MADTTSIASRMEKLAQLKRMKQGLSASDAPADAVAAPAEPEPAPQSTVSESPRPSLAAEIEAMTAEQPVAAPYEPSEFQTYSSDETTAESTEVETTDPGASDDDVYPSDNDVSGGDVDFSMSDVEDDDDDLGNEIPADLMESDDDAIAETEAEAPETEAVVESDAVEAEKTEDVLSAADLGIDDAAMGDFNDMPLMAGLDEVAEEAPMPDFTTKEIDPELLEREFASETPAGDIPTASEDVDGRVAVSFDESRSTLLNHVSRQMNCSVEDVVVTALDWYLDALFGEDGEAKTG